ncbi:MAG: inositol monophosphatase [Acidobacteria bacterium]|nr:inositol monophosphatase [Acidobacteriota bacterium]
MNPDHPLLAPVQRLHRRIRRDVIEACERTAVAALSGVAREEAGDTIYAIDRVAEHVLVEEIGRTIATADRPVLLVAEGLAGGEVVIPRDARRGDVRWVVIVDPIDGTRGLMYQKRPGWVLTGVAAGPDARTLADIELAVQTEIPLVKQHLSDEVWAVRGRGVSALRVNRLTLESRPLELHPSTATTIAHGFATVSRFFPGNRAELAAIDDEVVEALLGPPQPGKAQAFEDQYICTGGQLYELMAGHDRFVADLRPLVERHRSGGPALCCHPYDLCTELIARELGVPVTDERCGLLSAPLDVTSDVAWIAYANQALRAHVEPHLQRALGRRGLI